MADQELRVVISADASGVSPAVTEATDKIVSSAEYFEKAQAKATAASKALKEAQVELGAAAAAGNAQAASIIAEYATASEQAAVALKSLTTAQNENTASTVANTAAQAEDTKVTYNRMQAMGAARISLGAATGSVGAMEYGLARLAAGSSLVGPIMEAMVPYAVLAAAVFIIGDLVKGVIDFDEKATELSLDLGENWLQAALDQLDGFGDKIRADEKEIANFQDAVDKQIAQQKELSTADIGLREGAAAEATTKAQSAALDIANKKQTIQLLEQQLKLEQTYAAGHSASGQPIGTESVAMIEKMETRPEVAAEQARKTQAEIDLLNAQIQTEQIKSTVTLDQVLTKPAKEAHSRETHENYEQEAAALKLQGADLGAILLFWERINADGEHNTEVLRAQAELLKEIDGKGKLTLGRPLGAEPGAIDTSGMLADKREEAESDERINRLLREQEEHQKNVYEDTKRTIELKQLSPQHTAALETQASYAEQNAVVGPLQEQQKAVAPLGPAGLDKEQLKQYTSLQDMINAAYERGAQQREQITLQEAKREQQNYQQMFEKMYAPLQEFTDHWLTSGQRMGAAFEHMADQYAMSMINALMKIAAQELIGLALHKTVGEQERLDDAKGAFSGTYKAISGIPYVGPFLAPVMAAAAFAAVAAFDTGTDYVPKTGMAVVHQGERILNVSQNEEITRALTRGSSGTSGDNHFHYSPSISGIDGASVAGMARAHGNTFMRQAYRQMRLMGRAQ